MINKLSINSRNILEYHLAQVAGYANDIGILSRNIDSLGNIYIALNAEAKEVNLHINTKKTKAIL